MKAAPVLALVVSCTLVACKGGWSVTPPRVPAESATPVPVHSQPAEPAAAATPTPAADPTPPVVTPVTTREPAPPVVTGTMAAEPVAPVVTQAPAAEPVAPVVTQVPEPEPVTPVVTQVPEPEPVTPVVTQVPQPEPVTPVVTQVPEPEPVAPVVTQAPAPTQVEATLPVTVAAVPAEPPEPSLPVPELFPKQPEEPESTPEEIATKILDGETFSDAPPDSRLAKIRPGMSDSEVRELLGEPDALRSYETRNRWIPFYSGADSHRTDWIYRGEGRVVFQRDLTRPELLAIRVHYGTGDEAEAAEE